MRSRPPDPATSPRRARGGSWRSPCRGWRPRPWPSGTRREPRREAGRRPSSKPCSSPRRRMNLTCSTLIAPKEKFERWPASPKERGLGDAAEDVPSGQARAEQAYPPGVGEAGEAAGQEREPGERCFDLGRDVARRGDVADDLDAVAQVPRVDDRHRGVARGEDDVAAAELVEVTRDAHDALAARAPLRGRGGSVVRCRRPPAGAQLRAARARSGCPRSRRRPRRARFHRRS